MFGNLFGRVRNVAGNIFSGAKNVVGNIFDKAKTAGQYVVNKLPDILDTVQQGVNVYNQGKDIYNQGQNIYRENKPIIDIGTGIIKRYFQRN